MKESLLAHVMLLIVWFWMIGFTTIMLASKLLGVGE